MADLHLTDVDDEVLTRLRERARRTGVSIEEQVRALLKREANEPSGDSTEGTRTLRMPSPDRSFQPVDPIQAPGPSASELLIRDRDR